MKDSNPTIGQVLDHLKGRQLVSDEGQQNIISRLDQPEESPGDPLYLRIFIGIGAWFTALFLLIFLGLTGLFDSEVITGIIGIVFLAAAVGISLAWKATFLEQLSLALALAGNFLVLAGIATGGIAGLLVLAIVQAVICGVVYPVYNNSIYRFLAPSVIILILLVWIFAEKAYIFIHYLVAVEMLLAGILFLKRRRPAWIMPLAYSAVVSLLGTLLCINWLLALQGFFTGKSWFDVPMWPTLVLLAGGLIYLYIHLAAGLRRFDEPWLILAIVSTILLAIFTTPGILVVAGLLIIGHAQGDRILTLMACLFLPFFLVLFYYSMNIDLAHKSWVIAGSGGLLLIVRYIAGLFQPKEVLT